MLYEAALLPETIKSKGQSPINFCLSAHSFQNPFLSLQQFISSKRLPNYLSLKFVAELYSLVLNTKIIFSAVCIFEKYGQVSQGTRYVRFIG